MIPQGALEAVFWLSAGAVVYAYVGYPLLLALLTAARRPPARQRPRAEARHLPFLSVIVAAYNEARCIRAKLRTSLDPRYPWDRLEVIVVSDGSTDGTDALVAAYPDPRVRLLRQEPRAGKSSALNRGVAAARGDVLVFTDANALFAPGALRRLAAPFGDARVGLVSGQGLYASGLPGDTRVVGNGYVRYEALIKSAEAGLGFIAGADGAIYALRRSLYQDLDAGHVNDLLHPIQAAIARHACRFDGDACTIEPPSRDGRQEFRRHVRIIAQGVHLTSRWLPRLLAAGCWRAAWLLLSHRLLRWTSALFLAAALVSNVLLLDAHPVYRVTLVAQGVFYALALAGLLAERRRIALGPLAIPYYFCVVSAAGLAGVVRCCRSGADAVWSPTGGASITERAA
ncbi:MAG: glycosyltransferase [Candidatus Rokuibacteriota bacterium]